MIGNYSRRKILRKPGVESRRGVVAAQARRAAEAGVGVLRAGGNAVDAAIATALVCGVLEPWMSGIGGGGLMVIRNARNGDVTTIDGGMRAPAALDPADYPLAASGGDDDLFGWPAVEEGRNVNGALAIAVPGTLAGMALAHERYGAARWADLVQPAIDAAEAGLEIDAFALTQIACYARDIVGNPTSAALWTPGGLPPGPLPRPEPLRFPALARTLQAVRDGGARAFYEGPIAKALAADVAALGGRLSADDLAATEAREAEPASAQIGGGALYMAPRLNGGLTVAHALAGARGRYAPHPGGAPGADFYAAVAGALHAAFEERLASYGDESPAPSCTTHLSTVDRDGNVVAFTNTLLSVFGSKVTSPETGVLLNNGVYWFDPRPGRPNSVGPGKRPLCNYAPLVGVVGERVFAIGASGGRKIIPAMTQLSALLAEFGMSLDEAMRCPRIDASGTRGVTAPPLLSDEAFAALEPFGPVTRADWTAIPNHYACASAVMAVGQKRFGAADPAHPWAEAVSEDD